MNTVADRNLQALPRTSSVEDILAAVAADGGVILQDFLLPEEVRSMNAEVDADLERAEPGGQRRAESAAFHGLNTRRLGRMVTRSATFRTAVLDHDLIYDLCDAVLREQSGDYWLTTGQLIDIGPGSDPQPLHRDLENNPPFLAMGQAGPDIIVNFLIALSDFTDANGATRVIPGSHTWPDYEDRGTQEMTVPVEMKAGDAFFFNGKVVHGGGPNRTTSQWRRALSVPLQASYLTPEEPFPFTVDIETARSLSPRAQKLIGFQSLYPTGSPGGLYRVDSGELGAFLGI